METVTETLLLTLVSVVGLLVLRHLVQWFRFVNKVNRLPGPRPLPLLGSALFFMEPHNKIVKKVRDLIYSNPPLFRVWLGPLVGVIVTDPNHLEILLGSTKYIDKPMPYDFLHPWLGTGLLTANGHKWHVHRKMITPTFHFNILNSFIDVFSENCNILIEKLKQKIGSAGFDMAPYIGNCTLDIICETAMGTKINAQARDGDIDYIKSLHIISRCMLERLERPWLHPDFIFKLTSRGKLFYKNLKVLHNFTGEVIHERKLNYGKRKTEQIKEENDDVIDNKKRKAFLDLLLEACEHGTQLSEHELREEVDTFMFTGHDTTTSALCWCVQKLGEYKEVQEKAYEEQEQIFQGSDRAPSMKDLSDMKYLERVIKEVMRLCVVVPGFGRALKEDVTIDGCTLPAGIIIVVFNYITHRHPDHYPGDPEKFDPDRFLPEVVAKRHPYAYIPFSAGPRNCIGQKFAMLEIKMMLSYLLRNYRLHSLQENPVLIPELIMKVEGGVQVTISPRRL